METNIQKYLAFISAVEYNSFTKAAEKSGYTQSAISKMIADLEKEPFMLLESGAKAEISAIFEKHNLHPRVHFTTWDDYAIMSMVEQGLGIAILPNLILKKIPYDIIAKPLEIPAYRDIGFALKNKETASLAVKKFMNYLNYKDLNTNI